MPELPDLTIYLEALERRLAGASLVAVHLRSAFVLRSVKPPLVEAVGRRVIGLERVGKRLVIELEGELFLVVDLMIAGRLQWKQAGASRHRGARHELARFEWSSGSLVLTEASKKKRAWIRLVAARPAVAALDPGGVEPLRASDAELRATLARENRTLKRALTDPRLVAGIGNAYSDEILWAAAENEANYCPACQTGGRLLADRALSRLLHGDWPKSLEELEERKQAARGRGAR